MNAGLLIIAIIVSVAGTGAILYGFNRFRKYSLIKDTPRSKIRSMAMGLVELHGQVKAGKTIKTPFSQSDCVYYHYRIEEYRRETTTDSHGRTRTHHRWETIATGERRIPFFAKDETGEVYVDPEGAEFRVSVKKAFYQRRGLAYTITAILDALRNYDRDDPSGMDVRAWNLEPIDPDGGLTFGASVGDRRYYESYLEPGETLFLMGTAATDSSAPDNVLIKKGENEPTFIVSNKKEEDVLKGMRRSWAALFIIGAILELIGILLVLYSMGLIR